VQAQDAEGLVQAQHLGRPPYPAAAGVTVADEPVPGRPAMMSGQAGEGQQSGRALRPLDDPAPEIGVGAKLLEPGPVRLAAGHVRVRHPARHLRLAAPLEQALFVLGKEIAKLDHAHTPQRAIGSL